MLHVESSAVVAAAAYFISGWAAATSFTPATSPGEAVRTGLHLLPPALVPAGLLTVAMLWAPNCAYLTGVGLYLLFVPVSAVLGGAVAYGITASSTGRPVVRVALVGLVVMMAGPVYDLGFHPQFFTYNHVFGGVLGPIYDEQLAIRAGLFWFRGVTVLWIAVAVVLGARLRGFGSRRWTGTGVIAAGLLGVSYLFAPNLGVTVTESHLKKALPGTLQTDHFEIHYDSTAHEPAEVRSWALQQEFAYHQLSERLQTDMARGERILTFVYPSPEVKARLTGARQTSVAPVWLGRAQSHLLVDRLKGSFQHELAHLFGRPFGLPGVRASWSVGLVEGWAVALEPPSLAPSPDDLVRAARGRTGLGTDLPEAVAARLSPAGFWTDRGAVSYTTMGSFVSYLLDRYGPERLKAVYARADFQRVYGRSVRDLAAEWSNALSLSTPIDADAGGTADRWFARPSLLETRCPHFVPAHRRRIQEADRQLASGDTSAAITHLERAIQLEPRSASAHVRRARLRLAQAVPADTVLAGLANLPPEWHTPGVDVVRGDALVLARRPDSAATMYDRAVSAIPPYRVDERVAIWVRRLSVRNPTLLRHVVGGGPAVPRAEQVLRWAASSPRAPQEIRRAQLWAALLYDAGHRPDASALHWASLIPLPERPADWERPALGLVDRIGGNVLPRAWRVTLSHELLRASLTARAGGSEAVSAIAQRAAEEMTDRRAGSEARVWHHLAERAEWLRKRNDETPRDELESTSRGG
ncbi:MAG TPA: type IV pilus biogenesis/stability protein PilW [Longibacter sp.]